ncbi:MAG: hypothetical protein QXV52_06015 [Nitrososphaeria archaeon]
MSQKVKCCILLSLTFLFFTPTFLGNMLVKGIDGQPLVIGFGENERYLLYDNGKVYKLLDNGQMKYFSYINLTVYEIDDAIVDFEVYGSYLYLYTYRSHNQFKGETIVTVYSLESGERIYQKVYLFNITSENRVQGNMVLSAAACQKGFSVITGNTTHSLIEVYQEKLGQLQLTRVYSGRMAMSLYRSGDTLLAATFKVEYKNNTPWVTPRITDLMENKTIFELPALIPVAALAYPFIQVFNRKGLWECHVTVYNPIMNRIEYYIVYPEKQTLLDTRETKVSPYMDYLITSQSRGSQITFKDGYNITVSQKLSIITQGAHIPLDPVNGTMDSNIENKTILAKIVEGEKAKILFIKENFVKEIYTLNAKVASKTKGFYAALTNDTVYIVNPETHEPIIISLKEVDMNQSNMQYILLLILFSLIAIVALMVIIFYRKKYGNINS